MGLFADISVWWRTMEEAGHPPPNKPRDLTDEDRLAWDDALDQRARKTKPETLDDIRALIRHRNPIRWRNLQKDYRWVQKEMKKLGLNPEDARYIL